MSCILHYVLKFIITPTYQEEIREGVLTREVRRSRRRRGAQ